MILSDLCRGPGVGQKAEWPRGAGRPLMAGELTARALHILWISLDVALMPEGTLYIMIGFLHFEGIL